MTETPRTCERCGKQHLSEFVWLELDCMSGTYHWPGEVAPERSQGLFAFGATCAKKVVKAKDNRARCVVCAKPFEPEGYGECCSFECHEANTEPCNCNDCREYDEYHNGDDQRSADDFDGWED